MDYSTYSAKDFALEESFQKWVLCQDAGSTAFWEQWIDDHPGQQEVIQEARQLVLYLSQDHDEPTSEEYSKVWENIKDVCLEEESTTKPLSSLTPVELPFSRSHKTAHSYRVWYRIAAAFVGALLLATITYLALQGSEKQAYMTNFNETKTIILPDQSSVRLNANSVLQFYDDWDGQAPREIWLKGEAYFSVTHKENDQKFIVHANNVAVEVLGTTFNVSDRRNRTLVVLNTGKVKLNLDDAYISKDLEKHEKGVIMNPGEMVEISHEKKSFIQKKVNPDIYTAWKDNKLIFEDTPLYKIAQVMEDTYGVKVVIQGSTLAERKFTATYPANDMNVLLKALATSFNMQVQKQNNQIIMKANKDSG